MAHWCVFMLWFPDKVPCELSWLTSTFLPTMSNITKKSVPGLRTWCLREPETKSMKRLSSQRWPQAMLVVVGTEEIWEKLKSSLLKAAKNVWVYQETSVVERDLVVECGCWQCSQGKVKLLENLEEWWQQEGISEGQAPHQTCCLSGKT